MKKKISFFMCLLFFSLACVASAARESAPISKVKRAPIPHVARTQTGEPPQLCAVVIVAEAVHLRGGPSATSAILDHLRRGASVEVISQVRREWWRVQSGQSIGFVRSIYLQESECKK